MWKKHHYEFWKHANRLVASLLITPLSTWISGTDSWLWLLDQFCMFNENVMKEAYEDAGLQSSDYSSRGICSTIEAGFKDKEYGFYSPIYQAGYSFFSILPFIAFLVLNRPHDCYRCVGKDPERKYS